MRLIKKYLSAVLLALFFSCSFCGEANALLGNTHYNIGKQILSKMDIYLSEAEKNAFLSGMVYADIGRFKFDKQTAVDSDSEAFVKEMKRHISTTEEEWFVKGVEMHILQDKKTGEILSNIFGKRDIDYLNYLMECGILDAYFLNKNNSYIWNEFLSEFNFTQVASGLDVESISKALGISRTEAEPRCSAILASYDRLINKDYLTTYDDLLIKTYGALGNTVTKEDIHEQEANLLGACIIVSSVAGRQGLPVVITDKIDDECEKVADLCVAEL